ncbi:SCO1431 family membrane protein [Streptomyces sp. NPDC007983]
MTDIAVRRARTGGPSGFGHDELMEHAIGWTLAIAMAMFAVQLGLF